MEKRGWGERREQILGVALLQKGRDGVEGKDKLSEMESEREKVSADEQECWKSVEERQRRRNIVKLFAGTQFASKPCSS